MPTGEIHLADIGTAFRLIVKDEEEEIMDISGATEKLILFRKPSGAVISKTASFVTNGTDGNMQYVTEEGDLDEVGNWRYQGFVELPGGSWHTDIHKFKVYANLGS